MKWLEWRIFRLGKVVLKMVFGLSACNGWIRSKLYTKTPKWIVVFFDLSSPFFNRVDKFLTWSMEPGEWFITLSQTDKTTSVKQSPSQWDTDPSTTSMFRKIKTLTKMMILSSVYLFLVSSRIRETRNEKFIFREISRLVFSKISRFIKEVKLEESSIFKQFSFS